jgi:8-oxo-dGTP pyrophosphatase MutT (NUDIX family)
MTKGYLIIHDGSHVLVAKGGRRGEKERGGLHLPGGTCGYGEKPDATAWRELKEETGFDRKNTGLGLVQQGTIESAEIPGKYGVNFIVATAPSVADLVKNFKRPEVVNKDDEPFEAVAALPIKDCWKNEGFNEDDVTEWFGMGLKAAFAK